MSIQFFVDENDLGLGRKLSLNARECAILSR